MSGKNMKAVSIAAAVAGALSIAGSAQAAGVKCYGVAKAGNNDCANAAGTHSCAGYAKIDYDGGEWKFMKTEQECAQMHGSLEPFEGVNEKLAGQDDDS